MHPRHRMSLGGLGQTGTREPSRVSAIFVTKKGAGAAGLSVDIFDGISGNLIATRATDASGRVDFDLPFSNQTYIVRPSTPSGFIASPPERKIKSLAAKDWSEDKSAQFLILEDLGRSYGSWLKMPPLWVVALIGVGLWVAWPTISDAINKGRKD